MESNGIHGISDLFDRLRGVKRDVEKQGVRLEGLEKQSDDFDQQLQKFKVEQQRNVRRVRNAELQAEAIRRRRHNA